MSGFKPVFPRNGGPPTLTVEGRPVATPPNSMPQQATADAVLAGVREMHAEQLTQHKSYFNNAVTSGLTAGQEFPFGQVPGGPGITQDDFPFIAQSLYIDNPTNYLLFIPSLNRFIAPQIVGRVFRLHVGIRNIRIIVISGSVGSNATFALVATEQLLAESPGFSSAGAGAVTISGQPIAVTLPANQSVNLTQVGGAAVAEGQATMANSIPVVIASNQSAIANTPPANQSVNLTQENGVAVSSPTATNGYVQVAEKGTNNENQLQQTSTAASVQIGAARATLKRRRLRNLDAANSIWYREGAAATTTSAILKAGESADIFSLLAVNIIDNGSHASVQFEEWYD